MPTAVVVITCMERKGFLTGEMFANINVFFNSVTSVFKTIPVTAVTTVTEVIRIALDKFGLKVCTVFQEDLK